MRLSPTWVASVLSAVLSALVVAPFTAYLAWLNDRRKRRTELTTQFIDEFYSDSLLRHRIAVARLRRKVEANRVQMKDIAAGFWYPGREDAYAGETDSDGLNEHQHLEALLGYIKRLAHAISQSKSQLDRDVIAEALGAAYIWLEAFMNQLADEIEKQSGARTVSAYHRNQYTVSSIRAVSELMQRG